MSRPDDIATRLRNSYRSLAGVVCVSPQLLAEAADAIDAHRASATAAPREEPAFQYADAVIENGLLTLTFEGLNIVSWYPAPPGMPEGRVRRVAASRPGEWERDPSESNAR